METEILLIKEYRTFFMKNYPKVKAFALHLLKNEEDAEDIAQDIFMKLWNEPQVWTERKEWDGYLFMMTRNYIFNFIKHQDVEHRAMEGYGAELEGENSSDQLDELNARELELYIRMAVGQMPVQRRQVFLMSREQGLSNKEIAERLGLSIRTVERHLYLALSDLKKIVGLILLMLVR